MILPVALPFLVLRDLDAVVAWALGNASRPDYRELAIHAEPGCHELADRAAGALALRLGWEIGMARRIGEAQEAFFGLAAGVTYATRVEERLLEIRTASLQLARHDMGDVHVLVGRAFEVRG